MVKKIAPFILIFILSFFSLRPLFRPGFFTIHDGVHPQRVNQMEKAIKDFHIPPRWSPDLGYGYGWPHFSFYSPLPYYFGAIINLVTRDVLISTKILFAIALIFSAYFMYLLGKELFGELSGIIAGVFYLYSPYHALDTYVRGALAELWGIMFIPLVLFFIVKLVKEKSFKWVVFGGFSYAGLILSHNITALIFTGFLFLALFLYFIFYLYRYKKFPNYTLYILHSTFLGLLLSCYFWLPAILESKYTHINTMTGGRFAYWSHFIAFRQIWDSAWDYGASAGIFSGLSYMVGKLHLILTGLAIVLTVIKWTQLKEKRLVILLSVICLSLSAFLTNRRSDCLWSNLAFLSFIQFPWRFLIFVMFFSSLLSGAVVYFIKNFKLRTVIVGLLVTGVIFMNHSYFKPAKYLNVDQSYFLEGQNFYEWGTAASEEYLPIWRPKKIVPLPKEKIVLADGDYRIKQQKVGLYKFSVNLEKASEILVNNSYFPDWQAEIDGKKEEIHYQKDGLIRFYCPKGKHQITVKFEETRLRFLANAVSASTIFLLFASYMLK